jgi:hypothetical protein
VDENYIVCSANAPDYCNNVILVLKLKNDEEGDKNEERKGEIGLPPPKKKRSEV